MSHRSDMTFAYLGKKSRRYAIGDLPSVSELRKAFSYDPATGVVKRNLETMQRPGVNSEFGFLVKSKYRCFNFRGLSLFAHRIAWAIHYGSWPVNDIDHLDRDGLNNRIENLRDVTTVENLRNKRANKNNKSGFRGVYFSRKRGLWKAYIGVNSKSKYLGYFDSFEKACAARVAAECELGFHPNHGAAA